MKIILLCCYEVFILKWRHSKPSVAGWMAVAGQRVLYKKQLLKPAIPPEQGMLLRQRQQQYLFYRNMRMMNTQMQLPQMSFFYLWCLVFYSLGEERANLSAFRTFVRFALVWFCVSSSSWCLGRAAVCDCGTPWTFLLLFFSNLSAFRTFVRFALVWFCLFPLLLGVWVGLRFVIVALPGLFSYLCFQRLQIILQFKYSHSPFWFS